MGEKNADNEVEVRWNWDENQTGDEREAKGLTFDLYIERRERRPLLKG